MRIKGEVILETAVSLNVVYERVRHNENYRGGYPRNRCILKYFL
jgi:hypothetical protein